MAKQQKRLSAKEYDELAKQITAEHDMNIRLIEEELRGLNSIYDIQQKQLKNSELINEKQKRLNVLRNLNITLAKDGVKVHGNKLKSIDQELVQEKKLLEIDNKRIKSQNILLATVKSIGKSMTQMGGGMRNYFMASDAAMKSISLELGLSGERSAILRDSFEDSAGFAARMGIDMEGLAQMTSIYAEETGRARLHNEANLESMTLIAKGTKLGIQGAAQMAAQYEMMGMNAVDTANEVQRIVDTTERMGVNTNKVLAAVNKNFKTLQKYTFRGGVQGMADLAIYAEKFKINMNEVFEPMEKGRRLDSVIEMSAQLQVLGGQFANLADPLSMLFESRNDPEAYLKRINEMTKGMVTMRKSAEGFSMEIASPMARDQLEQAAKALGMSTEELTQQALRMREIQQTRSQMFSKGFTSDEKELIEGLAKFDSKTGRMMVEIGGVATDVSKLNTNSLKALRQEKTTLQERAEASQTFDQAFQNTIMELKATLLPVLQGVNEVLKTIRPVVNNISEAISDAFGSNDSKGFLKGVGMFMAGATLLATVVSPLLGFGRMLITGVGGLAKAGVGGMLGGGSKGGVAKGVGKGGKGIMGGAARGGGMLKGGLGVGGAALGMGAGVGAAAAGISKLADSMAKLTPEQAETLENIATTLAITFPAAAIGIGLLSAVAAPAVAPLLALGGAILGIGAGVGIAAAGIGYMAEGLSGLDKVDLSGIGAGMLSISTAALMIGNPFGIAGMLAMTTAISSIGSNADGLERVGTAFQNISAVLKGSSSQFKEVRDIIKDIASTDMSENSAIAGLTRMLSQPLKVEFSEKEVGFVANIDVSMGDSNFISQISKKIPARIVDLQQAKSG